MWTERIKYLNTLEEIDDYVKNINCFHDYYMGNFTYDGTNAAICIEEPTKTTFKDGETGRVWDLEFTNITSIKIENDCIFKFLIKDTYINDEHLVLEFDQGYLKIKADKIILGIPKEL